MIEINNPILSQPKVIAPAYFSVPDVVVFQDAEVIQQNLDDFSRLSKGNTSFVIVPKNIGALAQVIQLANQQNDRITIRALGLSQGGQAVPYDHSIVLSTAGFKDVAVVDVHKQEITCGAGVTWYELLAHTTQHGLMPYVMPLNLNLTVGGTVSVGGIGSTSHRYGISASHVTELTMVSGNGEIIECNHTQHPDAFYAVLAGLGRCGVISSLTLKLRPFKSRTRTYYFLYDNHEHWLRDQQFLHQDCDHMEAFCSASLQGFKNTENGRQPFAHWFYTWQVSFEYDENEMPVTPELNGLKYYKKIYEEDNDTVAFAARFQARFDLMRHTGAWNLFHPWFESVLPIEALANHLPEMLNNLPMSLGDGHRLFMVAQQNIPPNFIMPSKNLAAGFAVLPMGVPAHAKEQALNAIRTLEKHCDSLGGKRALSGWLDDRQPHNWQQHYGDYYPQWLAMKSQFDPNNILCSMLFKS